MSLQPIHVKKDASQGKAILVLLFVCISAVVLGVIIWRFIDKIRTDEDRETRYDNIIRREAKKNGLDPMMLKALIWRESKFDKTKIGSKGEVGLAQIMQNLAATDWARAKGQKVPSKAALADPQLNIEIAAWYLGRAYRYWREEEGYRYAMDMALCEYNAGRSRVRKWAPKDKEAPIVDNIQIKSTLEYVKTINLKRDEYFHEYNNPGGKKKKGKHLAP